MTYDYEQPVVDEFSPEAEIGTFGEGKLVLESGEYQCLGCKDREYFAAGELFTECSSNHPEGARWLLVESEADSEDG